MIDKLLKKIIDIKDDMGSNNTYNFLGYTLSYEPIYSNDIEVIIRLINYYIEKDIRIPKILEYKYDKDNLGYGYFLKEITYGKELYTREISHFNDIDNYDKDYLKYIEIKNNYINTLEDYSLIPREHLDKFIRDYLLIKKDGLVNIDFKLSNFYYDKELGFTFKNLNKDISEYSDEMFLTEIFTILFPGLPILDISNNDNNLYTFIYLTKEERNKIIDYRLILFSKISGILEELGFKEKLVNDMFKDRNCFDYMGIFDNKDDLDNTLYKDVKDTLNPVKEEVVLEDKRVKKRFKIRFRK